MRSYIRILRIVKLIWDFGFKKAYKKKIKNNVDLKEKFMSSMKIFSEGTFYPKLKTHKLTGKLKGLSEVNTTNFYYLTKYIFEKLICIKRLCKKNVAIRFPSICGRNRLSGIVF